MKALTYFQPIPQTIKIGEKVYNFVVKYGICLAYIDEEDVSRVLNITKQCCGGKLSHPYREATPNQIKVWETGLY